MSSASPSALPPEEVAVPPPRRPRPLKAHSFATFLDRIFLWIPNARRPGLAAISLFVVRQFALPWAFIVALGIVLAVVYNLLNASALVAGPPASGLFVLFAPTFLVQELNRYSFARYADKPARALVIFTATTAIMAVIWYRNDPYVAAIAVLAQVLASAVMFFGALRTKHAAAIIVLVVIGHATIDYVAESALRSPHDPSLSNDVFISPSPVPPDVAGMRSWARLYPGAVLTQSTTALHKDLRLTSWEIEYSSGAQPTDIHKFYSQLARTEGFRFVHDALGTRMFAKDPESFEYSVSPWHGGSYVSLTAIAVGLPATLAAANEKPTRSDHRSP